MLAHQQRVLDEKNELDVKINALGKFFNTDIFKTIDFEEQERLLEQHQVMCRYSEILQNRINHF